MDLIKVTDLKQWAYCPRIVYYHLVMPAVGKPTFKMKEAVSAQQLIESLEMRRGLGEYGLDEAHRRFNLRLADAALGLSGNLDLLLETPREIAVVDFKLTSGEPGENHRLQLGAYSMLAENAVGIPARRGFVYRIPDSRIFTIELTAELRKAVSDAVRGIRQTAESEDYPGPTPIRAKCIECEFANYCGDVW